ncbi:hypothetical protein UFOVP80_3 [uncultured Caudovirales phage]|jgi:hypothetical protein|uniref:Uncharacterized protein n=1 Tax=uncultured Caudovirales phage TaxID=2100421 RepID=A0A6J5KVR6_9CAUD|nr:hypothetical protein UFOVP80_3 [uncultured Caudovirales phage]
MNQDYLKEENKYLVYKIEGLRETIDIMTEGFMQSLTIMFTPNTPFTEDEFIKPLAKIASRCGVILPTGDLQIVRKK